MTNFQNTWILWTKLSLKSMFFSVSYCLPWPDQNCYLTSLSYPVNQQIKLTKSNYKTLKTIETIFRQSTRDFSSSAHRLVLVLLANFEFSNSNSSKQTPTDSSPMSKFRKTISPYLLLLLRIRCHSVSYLCSQFFRTAPWKIWFKMLSNVAKSVAQRGLFGNLVSRNSLAYEYLETSYKFHVNFAFFPVTSPMTSPGWTILLLFHTHLLRSEGKTDCITKQI